MVTQTAIASRNWRAANPEKSAANSKKWRENNPEKWNASHSKYQAKYRKRSRVHLRQYGLTVEDVDRMLVEQLGVCAICRTELTWKKSRGINVDHCHDTGRIRGLLCHACNIGLGFFRDDPLRLRSAIAYLISAKGNTARAPWSELNSARAELRTNNRPAAP